MRSFWRITALFVLMLAAISCPAAAQFTPFKHDTRNILEGNWQSCQQRISDGVGTATMGVEYTERIYDHVINGVPQFEVHLGPKHEFGIFKDVQDEHQDHDSPENLLGKIYDVPVIQNNAKHRWVIPSLGLAFTVTLSGGSRDDCESWFILLEPLKSSS